MGSRRISASLSLSASISDAKMRSMKGSSSQFSVEWENCLNSSMTDVPVARLAPKTLTEMNCSLVWRALSARTADP